MLRPCRARKLPEQSQKSRIVRIFGVIHVPKTRAGNGRVWTLQTEPGLRCRIDRRAQVRKIAQKPNGVSLDDTSETLETGLVFHRDPENLHRTDGFTHLSFQIDFHLADFPRRGVSFPPGIPPRSGPTRGDQRIAGVTPENRTAMVPPTPLEVSAVLAKAVPERCSTSRRCRVRPHANDPRTLSRIAARFPSLEEEINAALRPFHPAVALSQNPGASQLV